jgi:hypothetical protein
MLPSNATASHLSSPCIPRWALAQCLEHNTLDSHLKPMPGACRCTPHSSKAANVHELHISDNSSVPHGTLGC